MTAHKIEVLNTAIIDQDEYGEYSIPLCIDDIISICREYNKLGWQIQNQVESILEIGVSESIKSGKVKRTSLPHIKSFLGAICKNAYFGDAVAQAHDCIELIRIYEDNNQMVSNKNQMN